MSWILPGKEVIEQFRVKGVVIRVEQEMPRRRHSGRTLADKRALHKKIMALHRKGKPQAVIMKKLGVSRTAVWSHIHGHVK